MNAPVVVIGLDDSPLGELAFHVALEHASGGTLHVVHVLSGYDPLQALEYAGPRIDLAPDQAKLEARVQTLLSTPPAERLGPTPRIEHHVLVGNATKEIARLAHGVDADLVVIGRHAQSALASVLLGSVASSLVREAGCSVLAVREKDWA